MRENMVDASYFNNSDSRKRITNKGHRGFIGGDSIEMWYSIGILQYHFLVSQGMEHSNTLLDIGCGSLRSAIYTIPFLDKGNYFGIDAEPDLIAAGLENELPSSIVNLKQPNFCVNHMFDFSFCQSFDFAIAQSVFTHLTLDYIERCLKNLRTLAHAKSEFYFSFFEGDSANNEHEVSHANLCWFYSRKELELVAERNGWESQYIGEWGHPRDQKMMLLRPAQ